MNTMEIKIENIQKDIEMKVFDILSCFYIIYLKFNNK